MIIFQVKHPAVERTAGFVPHVLIPTANSKVLRLRRVDKDGVQPHLFVPFLHNHQFAAKQMFRGTKRKRDKAWWLVAAAGDTRGNMEGGI